METYRIQDKYNGTGCAVCAECMPAEFLRMNRGRVAGGRYIIIADTAPSVTVCAVCHDTITGGN